MDIPLAVPASGLLRGGRVLSLIPGVEGDAIWWQDGVIRAVGAARELERRVPSRVARFDLPRTLITPGFVDGHTHFAMWAQNRRRVHLAGAARRSEALRRVAGGVPEQGWLRGHGWDANRWEDAPDRRSLDAVTSVPAFLESIDIHAAWVNSAALAMAGIGRDTPDPAGGRIVRDPGGEPTGVLLERAVDLVRRVLPDPDPSAILTGLREAQQAAHRLGLTGIHDVEGPDALRGFRALEAAGELRLRVLFHPPVAQLGDLLAAGVRSGLGTPWLRLGGVKLFLDGSLGSRTAWMLEPYEGTAELGVPLAEAGNARRVVRVAAEAGISLAVHAIGDAAVRQALDLLEPLPGTALPHRIEHFQCVHPDDLGRAAARGIVLSMQPAHLPADVGLAEERWGGRGRGAYAFQGLRRAGAILAFGSDVPVATPDPRHGIVAAMARVAADGSFGEGWYPEERLTFEESVRAYTVGNAIAGGVADHSGQLAPGFDADLVVWGMDAGAERGDWLAVREAEVRLTVVGGEVVYRR
ncbi:MAG: amidohydrolase [Gemmatimonadetes bacterium]|nr:amidohydrolase [Gemmatimonadota bacterium]MBP6668492.1 amidohydrolase [Gemmatimonadales bacterium]MBK7349106.1 amidohydrolase [Gemmatimonadota bacterium]MBK7783735.1 amidohydrolase [Gemmatimonadota bacterium]MBK7924673.1 amidohydrolase [Gemmatimonadota bacterium]